jgi:hypothetical protein
MTLGEWMDARVPPVPVPFRAWMVPEAPDGEVSVGALAREAEASLERAVQGETRPRDGAFDLLAADGFLTYACEAALEAENPAEALDELIRRFAS